MAEPSNSGADARLSDSMDDDNHDDNNNNNNDDDDDDDDTTTATVAASSSIAAPLPDVAAPREPLFVRILSPARHASAEAAALFPAGAIGCGVEMWVGRRDTLARFFVNPLTGEAVPCRTRAGTVPALTECAYDLVLELVDGVQAGTAAVLADHFETSIALRPWAERRAACNRAVSMWQRMRWSVDMIVQPPPIVSGAPMTDIDAVAELLLLVLPGSALRLRKVLLNMLRGPYGEAPTYARFYTMLCDSAPGGVPTFRYVSDHVAFVTGGIGAALRATERKSESRDAERTASDSGSSSSSGDEREDDDGGGATAKEPARSQGATVDRAEE